MNELIFSLYEKLGLNKPIVCKHEYVKDAFAATLVISKFAGENLYELVDRLFCEAMLELTQNKELKNFVNLSNYVEYVPFCYTSLDSKFIRIIVNYH